MRDRVHPAITHCPSCSSDLSPTVVDDSRPIQVLEQTCDTCTYTTAVGVVWYPGDAFYVVVGQRATAVPCDRCDASALYTAIDSRTTRATTTCWTCLRGPYQTAVATVRDVIADTTALEDVSVSG